MPDIDVTDVLFDPDVAGTTFAVIRRQQTVDNDGKAATVATRFDGVVGAIVPARGELLREEAYSSSNEAITVISQFRLRGATKTADGKSWMPDLVEWQGDHYIVRTSNDYSKYGAGFIEAGCLAIEYIAEPPDGACVDGG